jgi:transposase-like protein
MRSVMKKADRNMVSDVVDALQARPQRRRWSDDVKAQIVAESYAPSAVVSEVARRHEISPQLLSAWRRAARRGLLKPPDRTKPMARRPAGTAAIQDRSSSSSEASSALGGPGPGHQFVQTRGRPEIDQLGEDVGQIGPRFDATELCCFDQRSDAGPVLRALIMPREQRVFSIQNNLVVILPISGRISPSTIAGIPCVSGACAGFRRSGAQRVMSYTSSWRRAM